MTKKITKSQKIRDYFTNNPGKRVPEVAKELGLKYQFVYVVKRTMDKNMYKKAAEAINNKRGPVTPIMADLTQHKDGSITEKITMYEPKSDPVNHPAHYKVGGIETIDFIEAKRLNYNMGNAVKYITRADHKGTRKQDIEKAIWYLNRELSHSL